MDKIFPKQIDLDLTNAGIDGAETRRIVIRPGITTFVGPNGSGKTQYLRALKSKMAELITEKKNTLRFSWQAWAAGELSIRLRWS